MRLTTNNSRKYLIIVGEYIEMSKVEIEIIEIIKQVKQDESLQIDSSLSFNDLDIDSIEFVSIIVEVEEKFGIEFSDDMLQLDNMGTITKMALYIDGCLLKS